MSKDNKNIRDLEDLDEKDLRETVAKINEQFNNNWKRQYSNHGGTVADYKPVDDNPNGNIPK
jgi:hypothetical protein